MLMNAGDTQSDQHLEPLLTFLDTYLAHFRQTLYNPVFTKVLLRTWNTLEEV